MSKSRKKQQARKRTTMDELAPEALPEAPETPAAPPAPLAAPAKPALDEAVYERVIDAVTRVGAMREEGERMSYLYSGPALSIKYVEASDTEAASLLVAAFREGVVFQVRGEDVVVYKPGAWLEQVEQLRTSEPEDDEEEALD